MAELLKQWLNEEVGLSKVSTLIYTHQKQVLPALCKPSPLKFGSNLFRSASIISKRISRAVTFWVSCFTSSTSKQTLSNFQPSKHKPHNRFRNATSHFVMNFEKLEPTLRALKI